VHTPRLRFAALTLIASLCTWQGWPSALMLVASLLSTFAVFHLSAAPLRLTMLLVSALWMVNAWTVESWEQMLANVVTAAAAIYGAWRGAGSTAVLPPRTLTARPAAAASTS
jgi:hypothetical protein